MSGKTQIAGRVNKSRSNPNIQAALKGRDRIAEACVAPKCVVCEKTILRPMFKDGPQRIATWLKRKTCQGEVDELGYYKKSECWKKHHLGKGNPNYKGIMPTCKMCGKKVSYCTSVERKAGIKDPSFCRKCFTEWAHKTGWFIEHAKQGVVPWLKAHPEHTDHLKEGRFKPGHVATNKKYDFCTIEGCKNKHLAKGLCAKHYTRQRKTKTSL